MHGDMVHGEDLEMEWGVGEGKNGRRREDEGKRVDGISKQADERQKQKIG